MLQFEPYHVHTCLSNCLTQPDSTMFISDYAEVYKEREHHVLCISEHGNRSNVWEQFDICEAYKNDKKNPYDMTPLAAAEAYFVPNRLPDSEGKYDGRNFHLILVAKNQEGFYELNEILSEANLTGFYRHARVDFDLLGRLNYRNFLCTSSCVAGPMKDENYEKLCCQLAEIFKENFYLEVQHHPQQIQVETNQKVLRLYEKYKWPLIYGTDSHYINKEDKILRDELLKSAHISYGSEDSFDLHLPTPEESFTLLMNQGVLSKARIEEAMENTLILREFEGVKFDRDKKIPTVYPELSIEERNKLFKKTVCNEYIRKAGMPTKEEAAEIHAEMDTITSTNTADYFLTLKKIVDRGKELGGVLTMTGRGSGASFVCNFAMGFTSINRLHCPVKMYSERFISADRLVNGLPDLDLNMDNVQAFEQAGKEFLGEYGCLPMIAFGTTKTLSAFKMLARARNLDFETQNEISKQISAYELDVKHAKENNSDDPDYDVDDDIQIESYVDSKYLSLIEESKQYKGIVVSISPHPCAHILLDKDIRREIGVIRVKSKSGNKDAIYAAFIDGKTADFYNYVKADFLIVLVVRMIDRAFKSIGKEVMPSDELLAKVKDNERVWNLYSNGFTMGLNQVEQKNSAKRCMKYKPRRMEELSAFIAAIRPGFRSMLETFINRIHFEYGISSLDKLLKTDAIPDSFLMYDEQILQILKTAGIPGPEAYACTKAIKKKKAEKVESYKQRFKEGFTKYLRETENASEEKAHEIVELVWKIISDAAQYMFCSAHSVSMCEDSLYMAWLKANYPYELYATMLKVFDEKKNTEKTSLIIDEMKRYKGIRLLTGKWGSDNQDWVIDKENKTISQSLSSIKYMSPQVAKDLYDLSRQSEAYIGSVFIKDEYTSSAKKEINRINKILKPLQERAKIYIGLDNGTDSEEFRRLYDEGIQLENSLKAILADDNNYIQRATEIQKFAKLDCFTNVLRAIQMNTCLNVRHVEILIGLNYFSQFGKAEKLMKVFDYFFNGKNKLSKTIKSFEERLESCREYESSLVDYDLEPGLRLLYEYDNVGVCLSTFPSSQGNAYFVTEVDDRYGIKVNLYSIKRGTSGQIRIAKSNYRKIETGDCLVIQKYRNSPKYSYSNGKKTPIPGEFDIWVSDYKVIPKQNAA